MDGHLSVEMLKAHEAQLKTESKKEPVIMPTSSKFSKIFGGGAADKKSDVTSGSKLSSSVPKDRFARLRTKLKVHSLLGGGGHFSKSNSEVGAQNRIKYENTFRIDPEDNSKFVCSKAEKIIAQVLETYLKGRKYDSRKFPQLCKTLSDLIKERVKSSGLKRFKIVAYVMITEDKEQTMRYASRCLWDPRFDNYATATYHGEDFTAIGSAFAVYFD